MNDKNEKSAMDRAVCEKCGTVFGFDKAANENVRYFESDANPRYFRAGGVFPRCPECGALGVQTSAESPFFLTETRVAVRKQTELLPLPPGAEQSVYETSRKMFEEQILKDLMSGFSPLNRNRDAHEDLRALPKTTATIRDWSNYNNADPLADLLELAGYFKSETLEINGEKIDVSGYNIHRGGNVPEGFTVLTRKRLPGAKWDLDQKEGDLIIIDEKKGVCLISPEKKFGSIFD